MKQYISISPIGYKLVNTLEEENYSILISQTYNVYYEVDTERHLKEQLPLTYYRSTNKSSNYEVWVILRGN